MTDRSETVVAVVGVATLAVALGVALSAALGLERVLPESALAVAASDGVVYGVGGLAVLLALVAVRRPGGGAPAAEDDASVPPVADSTPARGRDGTGGRERVDERVRRALERPAAGDEATAGRRSYRRYKARSAVEATAVEVLARRHDLPVERAADLVRSGRWTDDPRAAAFLGENVPLALPLRIEDWLTGSRYRRGLRAAVEEIERLAADGTGASGTDAASAVEDAVAGAERGEPDGRIDDGGWIGGDDPETPETPPRGRDGGDPR